MRVTTGMRRASRSRAGSAVISPSTSERIISRSAPTRLATSADNVSLSPIWISSVATVSFSLMMGITPRASNASSVRRALTYWRRTAKSRWVRRTCPTRRPTASKAWA